MQCHLRHYLVQRILLHIDFAPGNFLIIVKLQPIGIRYGHRPAGHGNPDPLLISPGLLKAEQIINPFRVGAA